MDNWPYYFYMFGKAWKLGFCLTLDFIGFCGKILLLLVCLLKNWFKCRFYILVRDKILLFVATTKFCTSTIQIPLDMYSCYTRKRNMFGWEFTILYIYLFFYIKKMNLNTNIIEFYLMVKNYYHYCLSFSNVFLMWNFIFILARLLNFIIFSLLVWDILT